MPINITSIESALQSKLNAATGSTESKEFLLLTKALESLNSGAVSEVATTGDLPTAADNTGRVIWVTAESALYVSNGTSWTTIGEDTLTSLGVTATANELNTLDGFTGDVNDLNTVDVTTLGTVEASKVVTADANGDVTFSANDKIQFGNSNDLQIYHDGSNSIISDQGTGDLNIQSSGSMRLQNSAASQNYIFAADGGAVQLHYAGNIKFATTSTGADVTGEMLADSYNESYAAVTSSSNLSYIDCHNGNSFSHTLTENTAFTFVNPPASGTSFSFTLKIVQDASASGYTVTWPIDVDWPSATAPTLTATASAVDYFVFTTHDGGVTWYGFTAGQALG